MPPCESCEYGAPEKPLMAENIEAMELWRSVKTQWRVGMSLVGLDYNVLFAMADLLSIDLSPCMLKKIQALEAATLTGVRKDHDERHRPGGQKTKKGSQSRRRAR